MALLLFGTFAFAQTTVKGTVVDQNNEPIPGANVVIVGKSVGAVTDFDGNFTLSTSETPPFTLRGSSIGYSEASVEVTSNNQNVTISLNEEQTLLDEIVISASRTPERIFESPVSVERFGLKEIENTTSASFYDGLQNLKGVDINTNSLTFQSINTRGFATFSNNRFVQLVDGMDNTSPALNFVLGNLVGMSELDVQSVEILPGASSALYGANAFNGILFMTSKNPFDFQGISAYIKTGLTSQEAAGDNAFYDVGIRAAKAFNDYIAVKASFSYLDGTDWWAVREDDLNNPGWTRENPAYNGLNVYGDEVAATINFDDAAGFPSGTLGTHTVSRTGYRERELSDYKAQSVKFDGAVHVRPFADDFEVILNSRIGRGSTIYQGTNRYYLQDFTLQQHKLEIKNNNFFVRGYLTLENSGKSHDLVFTGININRKWKADQQWFQDYVAGFAGAKLGVGTGIPASDDVAHAAGRANADNGRLIPGTAGFDAAKAAVTSDGNLSTGSKFIDETKMRHVDANYNFSHLTGDFADIQVGGSFREYVLNSNGTIFTDEDGPIPYSEFGLYTQIQKKLMDDRLKLTGSVRYDKNKLFDGFFSPRASITYTAGERRNHNFRGSFQTGFRNPTTQDLYIGLDAGRALLVGSAPDNLDRFSQEVAWNSDPSMSTVLTGRDAYENSFSLASVQAGAPEASNVQLVKPEQITAFELGYRGQLGKFVVDVSGYYNDYTDFMSGRNVVAPLYGEVGDNSLSLLALQRGDIQVFQAYTNSEADISSYGANIGVDTKVFGNFDFGINYTFSEFDFDRSTDPDFMPSFNTPRHKVKVSFGNTELFENFGFGLNYRWSDTYYWEATFGSDWVPSFNVVDMQINYKVPSIKSTFKVGGSNILADEYYSAIGTGNVGAQYYVSWIINN
jgi:outer membrane receptor protein involved in Fe transport